MRFENSAHPTRQVKVISIGAALLQDDILTKYVARPIVKIQQNKAVIIHSIVTPRGIPCNQVNGKGRGKGDTQ